MNKNSGDNFYIEIQRHGDIHEKNFESFNLSMSKKVNAPIIATNEVYYLHKDMSEAHDALLCIGSKNYINDKQRLKLTDNHYLKNDDVLKCAASIRIEGAAINLVKKMKGNIVIKIDDADFKATNPGVWCWTVNDMIDKKHFTHWEEYGKDKIV